MQSPISYFSTLTDPRVERSKEHLLSDIIFITIAAVICGAETWNDIELYGITKELWLKEFLKLPNGIPSHDTFNRVFSALNPKELETCFVEWVKDVSTLTAGDVISIDGKSIRGSKKGNSKSIVHLVSAWSQANHLVLGQVKVDDKSNEITAIPKLLQVLDLKGCMVTIDAMGCQREIAQQIIKQEAHYVLAVKGNQGSLEAAVQDTIRFEKPNDVYQEIDTGHGRIETRTCSVYSNLKHIEEAKKWEQLTSVVRLESIRENKSTGVKQTETRLYISSMASSAKTIAAAIRGHWGIENSLHWSLDVSFNEDKSQKQNAYAVENFSIINRIALNLLKNEKSKKVGVKGRRLNAGWDNTYLTKVLKN
jgi:predicted transposase YbfD/YdcC